MIDDDDDVDDDDCGAIGGMQIGRVNWSTRRKPAPVPLCPPHIPHDLTLAGTQAAAVGSRRLTARATARSENIRQFVRSMSYTLEIISSYLCSFPGMNSYEVSVISAPQTVLVVTADSTFRLFVKTVEPKKLFAS
jgi:hypothetical protein